MCGIVGVCGKLGAVEPAVIQTMLDTIRHRGPDGEGTCFDGDLAFGHRRLAILDLRPEGNQPMHYQGRYSIIFNGEIYNYLELRAELLTLGHSFATQTDTEVILAAYAQWGETCVTRFNGMWAFALYDRQTQTVLFSRDRYGVKPFYYWDAPSGFHFASEIKALWTQMPKPVRANAGTLLAYLTTGDIDYSAQTCFADVYQLPGGHQMIYDLHTHTYRIERWYTLRKNPQERGATYEQSVTRFRDLFEKAVRLRLRSDVPVGSTLSGGLDSSAIVCTIDRIKPEGKQVTTISSCFQEKAFDEQEYMDAVIEHTGAVSHKVWPDLKVSLQALDQEIWQEDEPCTSMASHFVYQKARSLEMPVLLVGEGADEQLAGYTNFFEPLFLGLLGRGRLISLRRQLKAFKRVREPLDHVSLKHLLMVTASDWLMPVALRDAVRIRRKGYATAKFVHASCLHHPEVYKARNLYAKTSADEVIRAYLFSEMPRILHCLDRSSMAYAVETRAPFLDKDLVEAVYTMPLPYKLWDGVTKRVLRDAIGPDMPDKVRNRYGKMGFMSPEFQWFYEDPEQMTTLLEKACDALPGYVNKPAVLQWCADHRHASARNTEEEWILSRLIRIGRWMEVFQVAL
ncbi:MAG: asparagine synthase (glutamine-hydrolyzing) [Candidatus Limiplasma sp.]|nr:asparagine synthase (glutamine-hydrolyzing) [Candidatus Limiplasma sp.]